MSETQYLYNKFKERDFIELKHETYEKIIEWMLLQKGIKIKKLGDFDEMIDATNACKVLCANGFIKYLQKGVIFIKHDNNNKRESLKHLDANGLKELNDRGFEVGKDKLIQFEFNYLSCYPFEFTEYGTLRVSVYVTNPRSYNQDCKLELLCKVECKPDTTFNVIDKTFNYELAEAHVKAESEALKVDASLSTLMPFIQLTQNKFPKLGTGTLEFNRAVTQEYIFGIIRAQILLVISTNTYLSLLEKEILISKNQQHMQFTASDKKHAKRSKRNVFYRYTVSLPPNYKPRKFDLNYLVGEWERGAAYPLRWVRKDNAEKIVAKYNGLAKLTDLVRGDLVGVRIYIEPKTCYRSHELLKGTGEHGVKTYTD